VAALYIQELQVFACSVFVGKTVQFSMAIYRWSKETIEKHGGEMYDRLKAAVEASNSGV